MTERQILIAVAKADIFLTSAMPLLLTILRLGLCVLLGYAIGKTSIAIRKRRKRKR